MTSSPARMHARRALVALQMAFAVVLLAAGALMLRTFQNLRAVKPGFDATGVVTMQVALPSHRYGGGNDRLIESAALASQYHERLIERVRGLPGVRSAGISTCLPLRSGDWCTGINIIGATADATRGACPATALVSPGFFETMGIRVEGATLTWSGMNAHDGAVVVSRTFAATHLGNSPAVGARMRFFGSEPPYYNVVGVAEDVRGNGVIAEPVDIVYFPMRHVPGAPLWSPARYVHLVVKAPGAEAGALGNAVSRIAAELDPEVAVANVTTMQGLLDRSMARQSFTMLLLLLSATIALVLSAVGIYGVISYLVLQRRGEIGVRMALGARASEVTAMVLRQSLGIAVVGVALGVGVASAVTRLLATLLYGVSPTDAATLVTAPAVLLVVAAAASLVPARRAARVDPVEALRAD